MAIRTRKQAVVACKKTTRNVVGMCQKVTREWFNAPSAGDQDKDGDADAVDGWLSEPKSARHTDRNPPVGVPLAFKGGSKGHGHRCMTDGIGSIRSIDMLNNRYKAGYTSSVKGRTMSEAIGIIERSMGIQYLGWSETIDGQKIPADAPAKKASPAKKPPVKKSKGAVVDRMEADFKKVKKGSGERKKQLDIIGAALAKIPYIQGK